MTTANVALNRAPLVMSRHSGKDLRAALRGKRLERPYWGWTIYALQRISLTQYESLNRLLDLINIYIDAKYQRPPLVPLRLPWPSELSTINIDALMRDDGVLREIFSRCVKTKGGLVVNLGDPLTFINDHSQELATQKSELSEYLFGVLGGTVELDKSHLLGLLKRPR